MGDRDLRFTTVSGDIDIPAGMKAGEISTHSTSGDVQVFDVECENFFSGNVSGRLELAGTITGDIRIESVSGDAEINSYVELDKVYVTSVSGDVDIYVDKDLDFKFTFDTVSGDFNCSFPIYESGGRNDRKGYTDESADMDFDINTVSGDLRIRN
jgi:lia operon protein LiaG